jgi:superfamily II DNA or RNA helicase
VKSLSDLIRHDDPVRTGALCWYPMSMAITQKYRFVSRYDEEVLLHQPSADGHAVGLPRALCPVGPNDERVVGRKVLFPCCPAPRPHQEQVFAETIDFLLKGYSGLVRAYTGWGKSVLGVYAAYHVGRPVLVITTKDDIYEQWLGEARDKLSLPPERIGQIRADKCTVKGRDFVVGMIHSLSKPGRYPEWIRGEFGLVIFDECHRVPADQFQAVAGMFPALLRLGLSATMERADGKELLVQAHIGPVRLETEHQLMVPKVLRFRSDWQCPRKLYTMTDGTRKVMRIPHEAGKTTHIEKLLAADPDRNKFLGELVKTAYDKGRKLVVFSTLHEHLQAIQRQAIKAGVKGRDIGWYIGATNKAEEEQRERDKVKPVLLTTYSMMGEGTNLPWLDCGLQATPRANVEQPAGRIRREYDGKPEPVWMDVVDADSPVFVGYAASRLDWYRKVGCVVKNMD